MFKKLPIVLIALCALSLQGQCETHEARAGEKGEKAAVQASPAIPVQNDNLRPEIQRHMETDVRVVSNPAKDGYDRAAFWISVVLAAVGVFGVGAAICTLIFIKAQVIEMRRQRISTERTLISIKRQTLASERTVKHMVASERPFLMIETRGTLGTEFWLRNCGKSPAQIIFLDPAYKVDFPEFVQREQEFVMKYPPEYGHNYDNPMAEQINVQWVAPGDEKCFTSFDTSILTSLSQDLRAELNTGLRAVRIYSSIKYRGMFSDEVFESRFCYGWSPNGGTRMAGPYGYNVYT